MTLDGSRLDSSNPPAGVRTTIRNHAGQFVQYSGVSVVSLGVGQMLLFGLHSGAGVDAWAANTIAVSISAIPAYVLYRNVVWAKRSRSDLRSEIVPFWSMAFIGLLLSTVAVALAERWFGGAIAVNTAYVGAFGSVWVLKYVALERWLFGPSTTSAS